MARPRIVSLLPSATEIVCELGFRDALVGRSHECDHPPGVASLPACTRPRFADGPSRAIDDRVRGLVQQGLSVYDVDAGRLRELAPDVIVTQDQCEVCAASLADVEAAVAAWTGARPAVVSLSPSTLGDVWGDVVRVGEALGAPRPGRELAERLSERVSAVGERTGDLARPRVACIEWLDPPMTAGHWIPELVALAGGSDLFGRAGERSAQVAWDALGEADPDRIVLMPCGFDLARTRREGEAFVERARRAGLRAAHAGLVHATDANAYFSRPGPRLVESLEILAEVLHPERFPARWRGAGWSPA